MSQVRQLTLKQAQREMAWLEYALASPKRVQKGYEPVVWYDDGGFAIWPKGARYPHVYKAIASDVSKRCHDCGTYIIHRHQGLVPWSMGYDLHNKEDLKEFRRYCARPRIELCVGCANKRKPAYNALMAWDETRALIGRVERAITKTKKEQKNEQDQNDGRPAGISH